MQAILHPLSSRVQSLCISAESQIKAIRASEKWYTVATVATTVALGSFLITSPYTSLFVAATALVSTEGISSRIQKYGDSASSFNRAWMITALLVSSSALAVIGTYGLVVASWSFTAFKAYNFSQAVWYASLGTGLIGVLGNSAQKLYETGLKLYKEPKWNALENYVKNPISSEPLTEIQRLLLPWVLNYPHIFFRNSSLFGSNIFNLTLAILPQEEIEKSFNNVIQSFNAASLHSQEKDVLKALKNLLELYQKLPEEMKDRHLTGIARATKNLDYPQEKLQPVLEIVQPAFDAKRNELRSNLSEKAGQFTKRFEELKVKVETLKNQSDLINQELLTEVSKEIQNLRTDIVRYNSELSTFFNKAELESADFQSNQTLVEISKMLTDGEGDILSTITTLNSKSQAQAEEEIDREDATWNFFLTDKSGKEASKNWIRVLQEEFHVENPNDLDAAMEKIGVSPLGNLIDNVLENNISKLQDKEGVWETIKAYKTKIQSQEAPKQLDFKEEIYSYLANVAAKTSSQTVRTASNVSFYAIMVFSTVIPLITYPEHAAIGTATGIIYYGIKPLNTYVWNTISSNPLLKFGSMLFFRTVYELAGRRPLLTLLTSGSTTELRSFESANIFGKLRIVSLEFFIGSLVMNTKRPFGIGSGGFIQGTSVGREIVELTKRSIQHVKTHRWFRRQVPA